MHTKEGWKGYIFEYSHKTLLYSLVVVACASHVLLSLIAKKKKKNKKNKKTKKEKKGKEEEGSSI